MNKILMAVCGLLCVVNEPGLSQCFSLDSIPIKAVAKLILNPTSGGESFHSMDIYRLSKYDFIALYAHPMFFVGSEEMKHQGVLIEKEMVPLINELLCSGIKHYPDKELRRWYRQTGRAQFVLFNVILDTMTVEADLYQQVEELLFGAFIIQQHNRQSDYLADVTRSILGCYKAFGNDSLTLQSSDIQLSLLDEQPQQVGSGCYWCFVPGFVVMSGPCYAGVEMTFHWELIQDFGDVRLCIYSGQRDGTELGPCSYYFVMEKSDIGKWMLTTRSKFTCE